MSDLRECPFCGSFEITTSQLPAHTVYRCGDCEAEALLPSTSAMNADASWNKRAEISVSDRDIAAAMGASLETSPPLSDDVKAVKKEGDSGIVSVTEVEPEILEIDEHGKVHQVSGLKEASEHSTHVRQNARELAIQALTERNPRFAVFRNQDPTFREDDVQFWTAKFLGLIAAPVTPKSEEELGNEAPLASKALNVATQNTRQMASTIVSATIKDLRGRRGFDGIFDEIEAGIGKDMENDLVELTEKLILSSQVTSAEDASFSPKPSSVSSPAGSSTKEEDKDSGIKDA